MRILCAGCDMMWSPFFVGRLRPSRPDVTATKAAQSGAQRTGQAENWGRPSGGTDFPLDRHGGGFTRDITKAACRSAHGKWETSPQSTHTTAEEPASRRGELGTE